MIRLLTVLLGSISLTSCTIKHAAHVTPQNYPGLHLENRRADPSFQVSTFNFSLHRYYLHPGLRESYPPTTKIVSAVFYTKVFEHQQKLGWCGGFAVADNDAGDLQWIRQRMAYFTSYLEVDGPGIQAKPRIWTGPFVANKSSRLEDVTVSCAVTAHPWLVAYETAKLSVYLPMDYQMPTPKVTQQGEET